MTIRTTNLLTSLCLALLVSACSKDPAPTPEATATASSAPVKTMHPSWDINQDGLNDCEHDSSCDDSIDYTQPRPIPASEPTANSRGPVSFNCSDAAQSTFVALFINHEDEPAKSRLRLSYQGETRELQAAPAASGSKYEGEDTSFWEHQGEASIQWRPQTEQFSCRIAE